MLIEESYCDICHKRIVNNGGHILAIRRNKDKKIYVEYDICDRCYDDMLRYISGAKGVRE